MLARSISPPVPPSISNPGEALAGGKFLLVDDNAINLRVLSALIKRLDLPFEAAVNGKEALDAYVGNPGHFAAILMDISMPVMNGFEATRQIRYFEHQNQLPAVKIIALSGLASQAARDEATESGVNLFLTKPVRLNQLNEALVSMGMEPCNFSNILSP